MGGAAMGGIQVAGIAGAAMTRMTDVPGLVRRAISDKWP